MYVVFKMLSAETQDFVSGLFSKKTLIFVPFLVLIGWFVKVSTKNENRGKRADLKILEQHE